MNLWEVQTEEAQRHWIREALQAGRVLTDPMLFLSGVDDPDGMIKALQDEGMKIRTFRKTVTDAAGVPHDVPAWELQR